MKDVLIIAHSPNILNKERNLDDYYIVKMTNCPTVEEYDKYISNRCDLWVTTGGGLYKDKHQLKHITKKFQSVPLILINNNFFNLRMKKFKKTQK